MSNISSGSSGTFSGRSGGRVYGVPKLCWCGEGMMELTSKTNQNPYRRFYRCSRAAAEKLRDDNHTFKWVDEALVNEIEALTVRATKLEEEMTEIKLMIQTQVFQKIKSEVEKKVVERLEKATANMRKTMSVIVVVGCVVLYGFKKILG